MANNTVDTLGVVFDRFGLSKGIVSNNSLQSTDQDFKDFCMNNGIIHILRPPYHSTSISWGNQNSSVGDKISC